MTAQRIRRYTPGGPSTQTRALTHTVQHNPSPAGSARTGAEPTLDPRQQARSRKEPQAPGLRPSTPATQTLKHAPSVRWGPPGEAPAHSAPAVSPGRAPAPARRRSLGASLLLGPGAAAAGWARPAAAPRCLVTETPGAGGGVRAPTATLRPLCLCPAPWKPPPPLKTPPLAAKLFPSRRSPALSQETTPLIGPRLRALGSPAHHSILGTPPPNFASSGTLR